MDLAVQNREVTGKKPKALRKEGFIPAELYGHGLKNLHLTVSSKEFSKVFKEAGTNSVVTLLVEKEKRPAIIHDIVRDPLTSEVAHIDFYQVKMDEKITAKVPLEFIGIAPAIKEKGAVLNRSMSEIEVEAFPQDLPHRLTVDVSTLDDLNKSIYVKDLVVPKGVRIMIDLETAIATATPPAPEEEVVAPVADVADVKVESEEKAAARAEAKADKPDAAAGKPAK